MMYADIIVNISRSEVDKSFQYRIPPEMEEQVSLGSRVEIPFGRRTVSGTVIGLGTEPLLEEDKIRDILGPAKRAYPLEQRMILLAAWMRDCYGCTMNQALKCVLPAKKSVRKGRTRVESTPLPSEEERDLPPELTEEQQQALGQLTEEQQAENRPCLIFGVTGSGKTELYMALIRRAIEKKQQAILLIPEISLTYQNLRRFYRRFGSRIGVINSRQSEGEKCETLEKARNGELDLVIGPRSALFTPFPRLGLVIIDEEHEESYRSELTPRYHAREVAEQLCRLCGASMVLGSATPSLESYYRCEQGRYRLVRLTRRAVEGAALPKVELVDLRTELAEGNKSVFSRLLTEKIEDRLARKEQIMLFLNRRGFAGFVSCRSCGKALKCPHCDIGLTYHKSGYRLKCHYCGYSVPYPDSCPSCGSPYIAAFGTGTQKVETLVQQAFPEARVLRMDADTTARKDGHSRILSAFSQEEADILVGTQMIVKGHDFPKVTLVGILAADLSLYAPDFRAAERTFALLTQAEGRAGRGERPGEVVVQTYMPEHYAITAAAAQDYESFYREEMGFRRLMHYPPSGGLLGALILGSDKADTEKRALLFKETVEEQFAGRGLQLIGPGEGGAQRLKDIYRQMILVKHPSAALLREVRSWGERLLGEGAQFDLL